MENQSDYLIMQELKLTQPQDHSQSSFQLQFNQTTQNYLDDLHFHNIENQLQIKQRTLFHDHQTQNHTHDDQVHSYPQNQLNSHTDINQLDFILQAQKLASKDQLNHNHQPLSTDSLQSQLKKSSDQAIMQNLRKTSHQHCEQQQDIQTQTTLESLIINSHQQSPHFLSINIQLIIVKQLEKIIFQSLYVSFLPLINKSYIQGQSESISKVLPCVLFFFASQFIKQFKFLNDSKKWSEEIELRRQLLFQGFKIVRNKSWSMVYQFLLIFLVSLLLGNELLTLLTDFICLILVIVALIFFFITFQTVKLGFYWLTFFILLKNKSGLVKKSSYEENHFIEQFICALINIGWDQVKTSCAQVNQKKKQQNHNNGKLCQKQIKDKFFKSDSDNFEFFMNQLVKQLQKTNYNKNTNFSKDEDNKFITNTKDKAGDSQIDIKQLSKIILELFRKSYYTKLVKLMEKLSQISKSLDELDKKKLQFEIDFSSQNESHPIMMMRKLSRYFRQGQTKFYDILAICIKDLVGGETKEVLHLSQIYLEYKLNVNEQLFRKLEMISQFNTKDQQISYKNKWKQISLPRQSSLYVLNCDQQVKSCQKPIKSLIGQELSFKNQLYEFNRLMLPLIQKKMQTVRNLNELQELILYIEESISIKLFLLNSKKSSLQTNSFTLFKTNPYQQTRSQNQINSNCDYIRIDLGEKPIELESNPDRHQISQYLTIENQLANTMDTHEPRESPIILYEQFTKSSNTFQKLDTLIQQLVQSQNLSQVQDNLQIKHPLISPPQDFSHKDSQCDSPHKKQQSSSDEDDNPLFNRSFNPFAQQQPTKLNIFSKSPFQFNFSVQQQISDLFKQKTSKTQLEPIKQYE